MKKVLIILFGCLQHYYLFAQDSLNKYGLYIIASIEKLNETIEIDSNKSFVRIKDYVPGVVLDIKYASTQNVFYEKLYDKPYAFIRLAAAKALREVQQELKSYGVGLKIYDAYRPYSITCRMWNLMPDSIYMGKPWRGSKHNRGIALDLTLVDLRTKKEVRMPTPYDALIYPAHPDFMGLPDSVIRNRSLLISTMSKHGFSVAKNEWWHFDFAEGVNFELLDMPHAEIEKLIHKKKKNKR